MKTSLIGGRVISPTRCFSGGLVWEDGKILSLLGEREAPPDGEVIDAHGLYIAPGLIDIHTHGAGGADFMDDSPDAYATALSTHLRHGVTGLMPATVAETTRRLKQAIARYESAARDADPCLPALLGLHLEGPYLSPDQCGAQQPDLMRPPDMDEVVSLLQCGPGIKRWSIAPELPGALALGRYLHARGIVASIAHSQADFGVAAAACDAGFTLVTHFYSGMTGVRRVNAYRAEGLVESVFLLDDLSVEVIADGRHLPASLLKLIYKQKGGSRMCLVTDSMRAAGMEEGPSVLGPAGNGLPVIVEDGVAKLPDRSSFAGSVATADRLLRVSVGADIPLAEAVKMATLTPARIIGADGRKGSLAVGKDADVILFDDDIHIRAVYIGGRCVVDGCGHRS